MSQQQQMQLFEIDSILIYFCVNMTYFVLHVISADPANAPCVFSCHALVSRRAQQNDTDQVQSGPSFVVVVAIDFGTTSSGYAYAFTKEPECIHTMRWAHCNADIHWGKQ